MKKLLALTAALIAIVSCSNDTVYRNPNLPDYNFSLPIDMTLPSYSRLQYINDPVYLNVAGPISGLIVMNTGSNWVAWEATCPNQPVAACSRMQISGLNAVCPCDDTDYSLFTGASNTGLRYGLKAYRVEIINSNAIRVYN